MNPIKTIAWKGTELTSPNFTKDAFLEHFKSLFNREDNRAFVIGLLLSPRLTASESSKLEGKIRMEELEGALNISGKHEAPGPNGINFKCLKKIWPQIKDSLLKCCHDFEESLELPKIFNTSFVALIPK